MWIVRLLLRLRDVEDNLAALRILDEESRLQDAAVTAAIWKLARNS